MVSVCSIIDEKRKEKAWSACVREEKKFVTPEARKGDLLCEVLRGCVYEKQPLMGSIGNQAGEECYRGQLYDRR